RTSDCSAVAGAESVTRGGGAGIGIALPNQTLPADRLKITRTERRELIAFLQSLTDTSRARP
ncbi:MAG TPA: hypothetical protein VFI77_09040, partial [Gemmatimonadales bacterium]|nr:hypothetical protein [Gemmatimonadales bacterium]